MELRKGQKIALNENLLKIIFERNSGALDIDMAAFLLQSTGKVKGDEDFVFYGNPRHISGSVTHCNDDSVEIDLTKIPRHVEKISITATIYEADERKQNFSKISGAVLRLKDFYGTEIATFAPERFTVETAIVLGEIYRYKGAWKFNATGAGYKGGLAALCNDFGIEVSDEMTAPPPPPPQKTYSNNQKFEQPKKIELRKGQRVNLIKRGSTLGEIVINLNWKRPPQNSGFFGQFLNRGIDLDLACLYELKDGRAGAVQALGNLFGSLTNAPYIALDGDDRTGESEGGENLRINGKFVNKIQRILIFTFIYEGAANWEEAQGVVTVKCPGSPELIVRMDEYGSENKTCAIALLENVGETFSVEKIVRFYHDSKEMDEDFDWGLRWTVGRK
ncbi:MAG: TerD domain-containing protein [Selenomonadaceae bacterium]|nr:TerD domain-containing protein [Selenomonadaceae bacterium]